MSGKVIASRIFFVALMGLVTASAARGGVVTYSGSVNSPFVPAEFMALGTFKPGFNPFSFFAVYGDSSGNLVGPFYAQAVADGNFRPLTSGSLSSEAISGSANAVGIEGQRLWLFLLNKPSAVYGLLASGTDPSWLAPSDAGIGTLALNSADMFVFGSGGHGQALRLDGLPFPEPGLGLAVCGAAMLLSTRRRLR
jgi:hypothetical protein